MGQDDGGCGGVESRHASTSFTGATEETKQRSAYRSRPPPEGSRGSVRPATNQVQIRTIAFNQCKSGLALKTRKGHGELIAPCSKKTAEERSPALPI